MFWFRICSNHDMRQFFKNINKSKIIYEVYYGWDTKAEKWFIDLQLPTTSKNNHIQWFEEKKAFEKVLYKISQ